MSYVNPFYHDFPSFKITPRHNAAGRNDKHQKYLRELYIIFFGVYISIQPTQKIPKNSNSKENKRKKKTTTEK